MLHLVDLLVLWGFLKKKNNSVWQGIADCALFPDCVCSVNVCLKLLTLQLLHRDGLSPGTVSQYKPLNAGFFCQGILSQQEKKQRQIHSYLVGGVRKYGHHQKVGTHKSQIPYRAETNCRKNH